MPFWMLISEFLHDIKANKTRAFLTTFAIMWGTVAIVLMMAFGEGFNYRMMTAMTNAGNNIIKVYGGQTSIRYQGLPEGRPIRLEKEDAFTLMESIPQIQVAVPSHGRNNVRLKAGNNSATTYLEGVYPEFEFLRTMYPKQGGRFLNVKDLHEKRRVLYIGSDLAEELFGHQDPIGQQVEMDGYPFVVVGVMQPKLQMGMSNGPDDRRAIIPFSTFESIYAHRWLRMITVRPNRLADTPVVRAELFRVLGRKHRFSAEDDNALFMWDFVTNIKEMNKVFTGIKIFLGIIGGLTLLIAGVGVANIMYVVVKERTREIGIKLAVGARSGHIVAQFIFESLLISVTGGAAGMLFTWAIVKLIKSIPVQNEGLAYLGTPQISYPVVIITVSILGIIGLFAGVFPARKAAALDPVESLRYE